MSATVQKNMPVPVPVPVPTELENNKVQAEPKITLSVDSLNMVATWKYDVENDTCALCHQDLMIPTQRSIREKVVNGNVTVGKCKHGFHEDCIDRWIKNGNISCTVCNTTWDAAKNVGSAVYVYKDTNLEPST